MRIVILDGYTLNPGDLRWDKFERFGELVCYDRTPTAKIVERAHEAEIVITNKTPLRKEILDQLPKCRYIGVLATGFDVVDLQYAHMKKIVVTNIPTYGTSSVAQMVFALLLELCHHTQDHSDTVHQGRWSRQSDFCYWDYPLIELAGKVMGIVGFGRIGREVARIASAFGMRIMAYDNYHGDVSDFKDFEWAISIKDLFERADVISLHCPLFEDTLGLVNAGTLKLMKKSAFLINTSRGKLVEEQDLADALSHGDIAGAGLDVVWEEPPVKGSPLFNLKNCIITPHIAWATFEARSRLMEIAADNLAAFLHGAPINVVNPKNSI